MKTTVLLADINDFAKVNEVYGTCKFSLFLFHAFSKFHDLNLNFTQISSAKKNITKITEILQSFECQSNFD